MQIFYNCVKLLKQFFEPENEVHWTIKYESVCWIHTNANLIFLFSHRLDLSIYQCIIYCHNLKSLKIQKLYIFLNNLKDGLLALILKIKLNLRKTVKICIPHVTLISLFPKNTSMPYYIISCHFNLFQRRQKVFRCICWDGISVFLKTRHYCLILHA